MVERTIQTQLGEVRVSKTVRQKVSRAAELVAGHPFLEGEAERALHRAGVTAILEGRTKVTGSGSAAAHIDAFLDKAEDHRQKAYIHEVLRGEQLSIAVDIGADRIVDQQPMPNALPRYIRKGLKRLAEPYSQALQSLGVPESSVQLQTQRLVDTKAAQASEMPELSRQVLIAQGIIEMVTGMPIPQSVMNRFAEPIPGGRVESPMKSNSGTLLQENVPALI